MSFHELVWVDMILWLKGIGLLKYKRQFIMSGLTKAKCLEMTGHALCEKVGIVDEEDRTTLKRALRRLQNQEKANPMKKSASIKSIKKTGVVEKSNSSKYQPLRLSLRTTSRE
jgi:hypothetical protein